MLLVANQSSVVSSPREMQIVTDEVEGAAVVVVAEMRLHAHARIHYSVVLWAPGVAEAEAAVEASKLSNEGITQYGPSRVDCCRRIVEG